MRTLLAKLSRMDWIMTFCVISLAIMGTVFIWSAGSARQTAVLQNLWGIHACTAALGLLVYFALASTDYRKLLDWTATPCYAVALVFLVAVLIFGSKVYGGKRWLWFFQPSEVAKLAVIMFTAHAFGRPDREGFKWFLAGMLILGAPALLILAEPDLGTALVLVPAVLVMLLAARTWTKGLVSLLLAGLLVAGAVLGTVYVAERQPDPERRARIYAFTPLREHQLKRLRVFLFPERDLRGAGYNLHQAQISIGSGSLWGKGLKQGSQKLLGYLPPSVSMNDFIFAVLAEEKGFMGSLTMLALFMGVLLPGIRIAFRATDDRGRLLVLGTTTLLFCHLYVNVAMSIGLMPITGLPLPFISAGRTFLIVLMAALGIVQSVNVHRGDRVDKTV